MLSRKYYRMIARVINNCTIYSNNSTRRIIKKDALINDLSIEFKLDNELFDSFRFNNACNGD